MNRLGWIVGLIMLPSLLYGKASIGIDYGVGEPDQLEGLRAAVQDYWNPIPLLDDRLVLTGYWDYSLAYWDTHHHLKPKERENVMVIALAPVFRLQGGSHIGLTPYAEASIGPSWMNHDKLGHRNLGAKFAFQDLLGFGMTFGKRQEFDLSYHFLHYSNAKCFVPNQGIDVKYLFSFKYVID